MRCAIPTCALALAAILVFSTGQAAWGQEDGQFRVGVETLKLKFMDWTRPTSTEEAGPYQGAPSPVVNVTGVELFLEPDRFGVRTTGESRGSAHDLWVLAGALSHAAESPHPSSITAPSQRAFHLVPRIDPQLSPPDKLTGMVVEVEELEPSLSAGAKTASIDLDTELLHLIRLFKEPWLASSGLHALLMNRKGLPFDQDEPSLVDCSEEERWDWLSKDRTECQGLKRAQVDRRLPIGMVANSSLGTELVYLAEDGLLLSPEGAKAFQVSRTLHLFPMTSDSRPAFLTLKGTQRPPDSIGWSSLELDWITLGAILMMCLAAIGLIVLFKTKPPKGPLPPPRGPGNPGKQYEAVRNGTSR